MTNTNLKGSNMSTISFKNSIFKKNDFSLCDFSHTSLKNIDFTTCNIDGLILFQDDLKGVILNQNQALDFVKLLGVIISNK
ncbi:MAG: pentapeptide repeat-containing protein [Clostridia bacterium]